MMFALVHASCLLSRPLTPNLGMENARCRNHANHNEYGIGSSRLGMGNADSIWYANLWGSWGAWGMLAWSMLTASGMPRMLARLLLLESWHGECYQHMVCQLYWHGSCYRSVPHIGMVCATSNCRARKKVLLGCILCLT